MRVLLYETYRMKTCIILMNARILLSGSKINSEPENQIGNHYDGKKETPNQLDLSRPDLLLDADWFGPDTERGREQAIWRDALKALLREDARSNKK